SPLVLTDGVTIPRHLALRATTMLIEPLADWCVRCRTRFAHNRIAVGVDRSGIGNFAGRRAHHRQRNCPLRADIDEAAGLLVLLNEPAIAGRLRLSARVALARLLADRCVRCRARLAHHRIATSLDWTDIFNLAGGRVYDRLR